MHPLSRRQAAGMVGAALLAGAAAPAPAQAAPPFDRLEIVASAVTGSGWTQTAEAMKRALASGDPARLRYAPYAGSGESLAAVLSGAATVGVNSLQERAAELASGRLQALAISSPERGAGRRHPNLQGARCPAPARRPARGDGAPGIDAAEAAAFGDLVARMLAAPAWRSTLAQRRWLNLHPPAAESTAFLAADRREVRQLLTEAALVK